MSTKTSSFGSPVSDTLIVSPMPSAKRQPNPAQDLMVPLNTVPASVTPNAKDNRFFQTSGGKPLWSLEHLKPLGKLRYRKIQFLQYSNMLQRTFHHRLRSYSAVLFNDILLKEPEFTPMRIGICLDFATSTTFLTLSLSPMFPGLSLILSAPFSILDMASR